MTRAETNEAGRQSPTGSAAPRPLTERELEVAGLVSAGPRNRGIAARLSVSVRTAESQLERIRAKLGFRSRAQIGRWIAQSDVLRPGLALVVPDGTIAACWQGSAGQLRRRQSLQTAITSSPITR